mgnify:CR=1 FL=1
MQNAAFKNFLCSNNLIELIKSELDVNIDIKTIDRFEDDLNQFNIYLTDFDTDKFNKELIMFSLIFRDHNLTKVKVSFDQNVSIERLKIIADVAILTENYLNEIFD